jgi:hypothetical protein
LEGATAKYSDRFFDLDGVHPKTIKIVFDEAVGLGEVKKNMRIYSITDTYN